MIRGSSFFHDYGKEVRARFDRAVADAAHDARAARVADDIDSLLDSQSGQQATTEPADVAGLTDTTPTESE